MTESDGPRSLGAEEAIPEAGAARPGAFRCGFVALVGRPNVGKSTLMNRLIGSKLSIVSDVPQTTRFPIRGVLHRESAQIVFIDTPGIHKPRYRLNEEMVRTATRVLREVDLVAVLVDAPDAYGPGDRYVFERVRESGAKAFLILNKVDDMPKDGLLPLIEEARQLSFFEEIVPLSALTGDNCDRLERLLMERMPEGPPHFPPDHLTDLPERLRISEMIREQLFQRMRQEVPHATAVVIDAVSQSDDIIRVDATIVVERDSQKGIVIGDGGRTIKEIGTASRQAIEAVLGRRVHLSLWVKVREAWRDDLQLLRLIGLSPP